MFSYNAYLVFSIYSYPSANWRLQSASLELEKSGGRNKCIAHRPESRVHSPVMENPQ